MPPGWIRNCIKSSTQSSPLNKIYYTNTVLPVESTITVDVPASAGKAYTQYADIKVDDSADLIIQMVMI